jgi:hypothetical protein
VLSAACYINQRKTLQSEGEELAHSGELSKDQGVEGE